MDKLELGNLLYSKLDKSQVLADEPMAKHTTFKVGGPVDFLVIPRSVEDIEAAVVAAKHAGAECRVIGQGSNILVSDKGLAGVVIELGEQLAKIDVDGCNVHAEAGATNEDVAKAALAAGLTGYEFASGIPGSIGGAAIMNAGAYDVEFKDVCNSVTCLTPDGKIVDVSAEEANWGYRHSMMMDEGYIVLSATLALKPGDPEQIRATMDDLKQRRESKQPLEMASAGSTFKRPTGYFAGKLIQDAGLRGHTVGGAQVSNKHCGFVVNTGSATAEDVLQVIRDVQDAVFEHSGVRLETEVRMWGFED